MYILFIPNPFAAMVAAGIMPVASIKWQHDMPPCRVLIYTVQDKNPLSSYPVEWQMIAHNAETMGNILHFVDQPVDAIIGWVNISAKGEITKLWNFGEKLLPTFNAHVLDEPFRCNIKHEGINFNFSPDDFVAHRTFLRGINSFRETLMLPVNDRIFKQSANDTTITLDLIGEVAQTFVTGDNSLREFERIIVVNNGMYRMFEFSPRNTFMPRVDERGNLKMYRSILRGGQQTARTSVVLHLEHELDTKYFE